MSRAGRPRDAAVDAAILKAAWRLLRDEGYARLSIAGVAEAAKVGRPAIYRRYRGKSELVSAVIASRAAPASVTPVDTGTAREDLVAHLEAVRRRFPASLAGTLPATGHPELLAQWRREIVAPPRDAIAEALRRGQARGEVRAGLDTRIAAEAVMGSFVFACMAQGRPRPGWSEAVVGALWPGFAVPRR